MVQHYLEELQGSLRLCTLSAGTDQVTVGDPVWPEALPWCSIASSSCKALCCHGPFPQALTKSHCRPTKSLQVIPSGRRPWCRIASSSCKSLCGCGPSPQTNIKAVYGDPVSQEAWCRIVSRSCKALCSCVPFPQALTKALSTDQVAVGDPVWQAALVQHCLEEPQCSLQLFTLSAGTNQGIVH